MKTIGLTYPRLLLALFVLILSDSHAQVTQQINNGASTETSLLITNGSSVSNGSLQLGIDNANNSFIKQFENKPLMFYTNTTGTNNERMRITSSGEVGIAETNPQSTLDIGGDLRIQSVSFDNSPTKYLTVDANGLVKYANANSGAGNFWDLLGNSGTTGLTNFLGTTDNHDLILRTNNVPRAAFLSNGQIQFGGIGSFFINEYNTSGTAQGQGTVNVYGNNGIYIRTLNTFASTSGARGSLILEGSPGGSSVRACFGGNMGGTHLLNIGQYTDIDNLFLISRASESNHMSLVIDEDADVKMGFFNNELTVPYSNIPSTRNPEVNLTVTGHLGIQMEADDYYDNNAPLGSGAVPGPNGFALKVNGLTYSTGGIWDASDRRFKRDIQEMENALGTLLSINPVNYFFKKDEFDSQGYNFSDAKQFGLIAQELELVLPDLVQTGQDGYKSVNYTALIPILIKAIQEQNTLIESQENRIRELESKPVYKSSTSRLKITAGDGYASYLYQNAPNPYSQKTRIQFRVSEESKSASIYLFNMTGVLIREFPIHDNHQTELEIDGSMMEAGMYTYTLVVDDKIIDSKKMILTQN